MGDDVMTRLQCTYPSGKWPCEECTFCVARAEIERLRAIVATVDDLHSCRLAHDTCLACDHNWPCPTHLLIHRRSKRG